MVIVVSLTWALYFFRNQICCMKWRCQAHPRHSVSMATMGVSWALHGYLHSQDTIIIHIRIIIVLLDTFIICLPYDKLICNLLHISDAYTVLYTYNLHHNLSMYEHSFVMLSAYITKSIILLLCTFVSCLHCNDWSFHGICCALYNE